jgi:curli biogenesis system outer membrane secretion channel CsgG/anti-sigma-K factor RskA
MKTTQSEDHAALVSYLLGELPESERERIEERYIFDERFEELLDALETNLVDAYVEGTLPPERRRRFESCYMVTAERRAAVRAAYLAKVYRDRVAKPKQGSHRIVYALAAGLLIALLGGVAWFLTHQKQTKQPVVGVAQNQADKPAEAIRKNNESPATVQAGAAASAAIKSHPKTPGKASEPKPFTPDSASDVASADVKNTPAPEQSASVPPAEPVVTPAATLPPAPAEPPTPAAGQALANGQKKRIAVYPFDYSGVMTQVQAIFNTQANIGQGIRAMAQTRLAEDGKVVVVEREKIDSILKEQDNSAGNRMKQGSGPRIGRVSGADVILAGDIVVFGRDDKRKGGGGAALGRLCTFCGLAGGAAGGFKKEEKAVVVIDYRLIDPETSEIITTGEARGESKRTSMNWGAFAGGYNGAGRGGFDMTSPNFAETIIGEATQDCVNKLIAGLTAQAGALRKKVREVEAYVADVTGDSMAISAGSGDGVNAGDTFEIFRVDREVKDPVTKEDLDRVVTKVGECRIARVRDKIATGSYSGLPAAVGMLARKKM